MWCVVRRARLGDVYKSKEKDLLLLDMLLFRWMENLNYIMQIELYNFDRNVYKDSNQKFSNGKLKKYH
jgi:hypothetical protein